jgi:hypothetical protein
MGEGISPIGLDAYIYVSNVFLMCSYTHTPSEQPAPIGLVAYIHVSNVFLMCS